MRAANDLLFEEAQDYKEKLDSLERYQSKSTVVSTTLGDLEVYSISSTEKVAFVNFLRVSQGLIVVSRNVEIRKKLDESDAELLEAAVAEMRAQYGDNCKEIVLSQPLELELDGVGITVPKLGDKRRLLELSMKNTLLFKQEKLSQYEKLNPELRVDRLMEQMKKDLRLSEMPKHIECFDNSNFQGTYPVSACVVFKNGKPAKNEYRHFNVRTVEGPDDFATMKEALTRRYTRLLEEKKPLPQLIVVDGGKGQLSAAVEALKAIGERMGGFDLAAIAIGAYEPRWFMKDSHLNPKEALQAMTDVKAKAAMGIHWGTFDGMSDEPLDQAPKDLEIAKKEFSLPLNFFVLKHGESWVGR